MSEASIVAIIVGFGVPVATFVFTLLSSRQSASREAALDERRGERERRLAHESRIHGWRADAYRDLLRVLRRTRIVIEMVMPILDEGRKPPPVPTEDEMDAMESAVAAFGSASVRERLEAMRRTQNEFFWTVQEYNEGEARGEGPGSKDQLGLYRKVDDIRKRWRELHDAMKAEVAAELQDLAPPS